MCWLVSLCLSKSILLPSLPCSQPQEANTVDLALGFIAGQPVRGTSRSEGGKRMFGVTPLGGYFPHSTVLPGFSS